MDWQTRMARALEYLEAHLYEEMDLEAAAREVFEETGLSDVSIHPEPCYIFEFSKNNKRFREYVFGATTTSPDIILSSEHDDSIWLPYKQALEYLHWDSNKTGLEKVYESLESS